MRWTGWLVLLAGCSMGCADGAGGETDAAAVASAIPPAAADARGADYPPAGAASVALPSTGLAECDAYFEMIRNCHAMPPSAKKSMEQAEEAMRQAAARATTPEARAAIGKACEQARAALTMCDPKPLKHGPMRRDVGF